MARGRPTRSNSSGNLQFLAVQRTLQRREGRDKGLLNDREALGAHGFANQTADHVSDTLDGGGGQLITPPALELGSPATPPPPHTAGGGGGGVVEAVGDILGQSFANPLAKGAAGTHEHEHEHEGARQAPRLRMDHKQGSSSPRGARLHGRLATSSGARLPPSLNTACRGGY
jgi:hypothetical protein